MAELIAYDTGNDGNAEQYGDIRIAQTFTLAQAATLSDLEVLIYREGTPGTISVSLYTTTLVEGEGDIPDSHIRTIGFSGNTLTADTGGEWKSISYSGGQEVEAGTYAIVVSGGTDASNSVHWNEDASAPSYSGGNKVTSPNAGVTWVKVAATDMMFRVNGSYGYVFTPPSGRPTTKLLVGFAGSTLWYEDV